MTFWTFQQTVLTDNAFLRLFSTTNSIFFLHPFLASTSDFSCEMVFRVKWLDFQRPFHAKWLCLLAFVGYCPAFKREIKQKSEGRFADVEE
jgi:hypothetical protein